MIIGVDTGGTKTLVTVFDDNGILQDKQKFLTPRDIHVYIEQVVSTILAMAPQRSELKAISVAVPGTVENQIAVVCKNLGWQNIDILGLLRTHFPEVPMWLENDANLGGVGTTWLLDPQPNRCLYITISTGIGAGFVIDGTISQDLATAEVGDMVIECDGRVGTWEGMASGSAILAEYSLYANELTDARAIRDISKRIARGFQALLPVLRPDIVAVGGGVGAHFDRFSQHVDEAMEMLRKDYRCPIVTAPYPEEIVAYGCYFHAEHKLNA
jgi:predicted NBD/HSP70 family sugar kinase